MLSFLQKVLTRVHICRERQWRRKSLITLTPDPHWAGRDWCSPGSCHCCTWRSSWRASSTQSLACSSRCRCSIFDDIKLTFLRRWQRGKISRSFCPRRAFLAKSNICESTMKSTTFRLLNSMLGSLHTLHRLWKDFSRTRALTYLASSSVTETKKVVTASIPGRPGTAWPLAPSPRPETEWEPEVDVIKLLSSSFRPSEK
jgi:hypothetical protein